MAHRPCLRGMAPPEARGRGPRHPPVQRGTRRGADPRAHGLRRRRRRHRPVWHRGRLFRDLLGGARRRHHGDREPQPTGLQRAQVRARTVASDQRRQRPAGNPQARRGQHLRGEQPAGKNHAFRHHAVLPRTPARLCGPGQAAAADHRLQPRQWRGRAGHRPDREGPAVPVHQGPPRAGRHFPARRAQPDAGGEPRGHLRRGTAFACSLRRCLRRRLRSLLLLR